MVIVKHFEDESYMSLEKGKLLISKNNINTDKFKETINKIYDILRIDESGFKELNKIINFNIEPKMHSSSSIYSNNRCILAHQSTEGI